MEQLRQKISTINNKSYKAYKELKGKYDFESFWLRINHVQGDPFSHPSRISIFLTHEQTGLPSHLWSNAVRQTACEDFLARCIQHAIAEIVSPASGSGRSGEVAISANGQQVLKRNCVLITSSGIEARITVGLPANNRRINSAEAIRILIDELSGVVRSSLIYKNLPHDEFAAHVDCVEDQSTLRDLLDELGLIAFVADGAQLPRQSGVDDAPMSSDLIPIRSPDSLAVEVTLPHRGTLRGLGIKKGITLIVGGGFHGKSTLLRALERGVYNHIPGDGREFCITEPDAVTIRAEDERCISRLDISAFINNLPLGQTTSDFSNPNASGSTSQAANIIEALHSGCRALLIDEDTSATNFMIRDKRMQQLVPDEKEPITPFLHRVRELYIKHGVSSVIVMGGSGDYFSIADTVIMMDNYELNDATDKAKSLADAPQLSEPYPDISLSSSRCPTNMDWNLNGKTRISARGTKQLLFGQQEIDLSKVDQLVDSSQVETIGWMLKYYAENIMADCNALVSGIGKILQILDENGLDVFTPYKHVGNLAVPRKQELMGAINRIRGLDWRIQK